MIDRRINPGSRMVQMKLCCTNQSRSQPCGTQATPKNESSTNTTTQHKQRPQKTTQPQGKNTNSVTSEQTNTMNELEQGEWRVAQGFSHLLYRRLLSGG